MTETPRGPKRDTIRTRKLSEAIREVKNAVADRSDVLADIRDARRARIDILIQELEPVIADVRSDDRLFDLAVSSGLEPRFWVDAVAFVSIGRDGRTYIFRRQRRGESEIIAENASPARMAEQVMYYIAERMVDRERQQVEGASPSRRVVRQRADDRFDAAAAAAGEAAVAYPGDGSSGGFHRHDQARGGPRFGDGLRSRAPIVTTVLLALLVMFLGMAIGFVVIALLFAPDLLFG